MDNPIEILKVILIGLIEGFTEWLPISSTGHIILADAVLKLKQSEAFKEMFFVVIQLSAILAVIALYWEKLNPFSLTPRLVVKREIISLWSKIMVSCIPAAIIGLVFDDEINVLFYNYQTVVVTLILYGIIFIFVEILNKKWSPAITSVQQITYRIALLIGVFQLLALIPGTSRSGATIIGALLIGATRPIAAEFSFFLAIPVILGASLVKLTKFGFSFTNNEILILLIGMAISFIVSIFAIKFLVRYVQKHDFQVFGWYRIILGLLIGLFFYLNHG